MHALEPHGTEPSERERVAEPDEAGEEPTPAGAERRRSRTTIAIAPSATIHAAPRPSTKRPAAVLCTARPIAGPKGSKPYSSAVYAPSPSHRPIGESVTQDDHAGNRAGPAHVVRNAELRVLHLPGARLASELRHDLVDHPHAARRWVPEGLEAARRVDRDVAVARRAPFLDELPALALLAEAEVLDVRDLGPGEAVVDFGEDTSFGPMPAILWRPVTPSPWRSQVERGSKYGRPVSTASAAPFTQMGSS
jgi:hypothetical protein